MSVPGSILFCALAILIALTLIWLSQKKRAAVGRRSDCNCYPPEEPTDD